MIGLAAIAPSLVWIFIAQACYGFAGGNNYPVLMGLCIMNVSKSERSTAMGLHQSIYGVGAFASPWLSGIIAKAIGIQPMIGLTAFAMLFLGLIGVRYLSANNNSG